MGEGRDSVPDPRDPHHKISDRDLDHALFFIGFQDLI